MRDYIVVPADKTPTEFNLFELLGVIVTAASEEEAKTKARKYGIIDGHIVMSRPSFRLPLTMH